MPRKYPPEVRRQVRIKNSRNFAQLPAVAPAAGVSWINASLAWEAGKELDRWHDLV
jgi:hypothetical protein